MIGREREAELLLAALIEILDGAGSLVLLTGEPGSGKTRLAEELARRARQLGASVAWGRCWEEEGAPDLWPWLQVIRACLRVVDDATLRELVGPHGNELTALVAPLHEPGRDVAPTPESPAARFRLFNAIAHFLDAFARRGPLLAVLDDVHSADAPSLLLLQFLTQEQRQRPLLLLASYREPGAVANRALTQAVVEASRDPATKRIHLGNLHRADSAALLAVLLGSTPAEPLVDELHRRTGGNPLFLSECAHQIRASGASGFDLPIPRELRQVIERRLAALSLVQRDCLRLAALLGPELRREALEVRFAQTAGGTTESTAAALAAAEGLGLLSRGAAPGSYRFVHGMVQEVLLDEIPSALRAAASPLPAAAEMPRTDATSLFRREGEYWSVAFGGSSSRVRDAKGLAYIALLLRHPRKPLHVSELVSLGGAAGGDAEPSPGRSDDAGPTRVGLGDAGVVLDAQAKAEYRRRLEDLRAELDQAEEHHDAGRAERARQEIDFLGQELSAAVGLGGRDRRVGSAAERARVNVTRSISRAIERIDESHPELARYLGQTIRTGTFCTYLPDATVGTSWEF